MSSQADATNALLREKNVLPPAPPADGSEGENDESKRPDLPQIRLPGANRGLGEFAHELGAVMCKNGVYLRDEVPMVLNKKRVRLQELTSKAFRSYVERHAFIYYPKAGGDGEETKKVKMTMKKDIAADTLASFDFLDLQRQIRRVNAVPMPSLRRGGALELLEPGYDYETQILTMPSALSYEVLPVDEARRRIQERFKHFAFPDRGADGNSRSLAVHVAAMLTPFCLSLLSTKSLVPMFIYTANKQGSGKSLLCKSALYASFGTAASLPFGRDEEELRKQLDTEALEGVPYIFFDNVKRKIQSPFLDAWLTQAEWKGRRMGGQHEFKVEKQNVVFVSSNHAAVDKDANRRALFVELFLEDADINDRKFETVIDDDYLAREDVRRDILSDLWSLVVHWDHIGRPAGPRSLGSFEQWARVIGGIVHAAGFGDPLVPHIIENGGDSDTKDVLTLVKELARRLKLERDDMDDGEEPPRHWEFEFQEIIDICRDKDLFVERIDEAKNKDGVMELKRSSRIQMGKLLQKEAGQVWKIDDLGRVRFGRKGSKNWRSFVVELV